MSTPTIAKDELLTLDPVLPPDNLPEDDGEPLETPWHRKAMTLLIESVEWHWRDRDDFFVGGNMFVYYSAREPADRRFRGPDFFVVKDVERRRVRRKWEAWNEDSRLPDVIIELLSPTTAGIDRTEKKELYERTFRTAEYICYDPDKKRIEGWRMNARRRYQDILPNDRGWLWSEELGLWIGSWHGVYAAMESDWPRFFTPNSQLVLNGAESEHQRAEAEHARATAAEAEIERLRHELEQLKKQSPGNPSA
jgi:Uma2 family endonuclease